MKYYIKPLTSMVEITMTQQVLAGSSSTDVQLKSSGEVKPGEKQYAV